MKNKNLVITLVALLLVALAGSLVFFIISETKNRGTENSISKSEQTVKEIAGKLDWKVELQKGSFNWRVDAEKEITVEGYSFETTEKVTQDVLNVYQWFENNNFEGSAFNAADGPSASIMGWEKNNIVCIMENTDVNYGIEGPTESQTITIYCGALK